MIVSKPQTATNPFYMVLVIAGILFVITACAYFTMAVREAGGVMTPSNGLMAIVSRHGMTVLIAELVLLAIATFGAIATDEHWSRRAADRLRAESRDKISSPDQEPIEK
jgi:hypothetical protein